MIYDFTKGKSALYFSTLLHVEYNFDFSEFELSHKDLEFDEIGYFQRSKKNGFTRLGIFLPEYNDKQFGSYPALHIYNCNTTDDLSRRMRVTLSSHNTFYSRDQNKSITTTLEICKKCARNLRNKYSLKLGTNTFNNFVLALEENDRTKQKITDNRGYILNWQQVSYCYRDSKEFTCEKCSFTIKEEKNKKFLHTHHVSGDKRNNQRHNLQCLCVTCHSEVDDHHRKKFALDGLKQLTEFTEFLEKQNKKNIIVTKISTR